MPAIALAADRRCRHASEPDLTIDEACQALGWKTAFLLMMPNLGATGLLVPLAAAAGGDPAVFALTVVISTSNSFIIPTHQANALIMGPAGYKMIDFVRAGGLMTVIFLVCRWG